MPVTKQQALEYHFGERPGKIEVTPSKPCRTQKDLSLAYTPGVADPCLEIAKNPHDAFKYTARGKLVAVVSNGTAVLRLGDIGALAGKPVMEGKGVLFKRFADVDVFDLEVDGHNPEDIIKLCQLIEPTIGGINPEDIKAPECFYIEETLKKTMKIPVFHDDQHGTASISGAALLNALEIVDKPINQVKGVFNGAGASGIACAEHYVRLGVKRENITLCDTKGVVYKGRTAGMNAYKERFAKETPLRTLAEAMRGADVFLGCSVKGAVRPEMLRAMASRPIVFAMANPDPEITYEEAKLSRSDVILATGRSDYPNQVNSVLGFPFIFRGALDVRATAINEEMKLAGTRALADLAKEDVPDSVCRAYGVERLKFGPDYLIPKPFDPRVLLWEAVAVARAAMESGVAQEPVNLEALSGAAGTSAREGARDCADDGAQGAGEPEDRGFSGRRSREDFAGLPHAGGREHRGADSARQCGSHSQENSRARAGFARSADRGSCDGADAKPLTAGTVSSTAAARSDIDRSTNADREPQCVRVDDAAQGRRGRIGFRCEPAFPRHDPSWSRNCSRA